MHGWQWSNTWGTSGISFMAIDYWLAVELCPRYYCTLGNIYFTYIAWIESTLLGCNETQWMVNESVSHTCGFSCNLGLFVVLRLDYFSLLWVVQYERKLKSLGTWRVQCLKMRGSIFPAKPPFVMPYITHPNILLPELGALLLHFVFILFSFILHFRTPCS